MSGFPMPPAGSSNVLDRVVGDEIKNIMKILVLFATLLPFTNFSFVPM
jgi:hypothetical protein